MLKFFEGCSLKEGNVANQDEVGSIDYEEDY
jgi:hypothetical protein